MVASSDRPRHSISRPYELAAALRAIRREQNLTQAQLASLSGTSRQWISEAENNKLPFGVALVCRLVYELGYQMELVPAPAPAAGLEAHLAGMVGEPADVFEPADTGGPTGTGEEAGTDGEAGDAGEEAAGEAR